MNHCIPSGSSWLASAIGKPTLHHSRRFLRHYRDGGRLTRLETTLVATFVGLFAALFLTPFTGAIASPLILNGTPPPVPTFTVINTNDTGAGSLRQAMLDANANPGFDRIEFDIPGAGPHTIQPLSALPTITDPVNIDGYTQAGASPNTNGPGLGLNTVLKIELDGSSAGTGVNGLWISAGGSTVRGLVINRFDTNGMMLLTNGSNVIEGNFIGTDVTGTAALGNAVDGVLISGAPGNIIGGTTPGAGNLISGNRRGGAFIFGDGAGIVIKGSGATGNQVQGNFIGTDVTGTAELGNLRGVLAFDTPGSTIGGTTSQLRNIISGNDRAGVRIDSAGTGIVIQGNFIGTDVTGNATVGNGQEGVVIFGASNNVIGGTISGAGNVISGNGRLSVAGGVRIAGGAGNLVQGNFIGTDVTGTVALGNSGNGGVHISGVGNFIGGTTVGAGNIISGNLTGVSIHFGSGNLVKGNFIGTDVTGTLPLGNSFGVFISFNANGNTFGGTTSGAGNVIAFNGVGVFVFSGTGNAILSNSIFANTGLGIDLSPSGVTPNDAGDGDAGANNLQNFPALDSAESGADTVINGTLNSTANTQFQVEFFSNTVCDPSGFGEGETFLGSADVTTDGAGNTAFHITIPTPVTVGHFITSTATNPGNNTSEFSECEEVSEVVDDVPPSVGILVPAEDTKTVHGELKEDEVDATTVIGSANVTASAVDTLSGVASVVFEVDGALVPAGEVTQVGDTWTFLFEPDLKGEHNYLIEVTATDHASNSATASIEILGVKTGKQVN